MFDRHFRTQPALIRYWGDQLTEFPFVRRDNLGGHLHRAERKVGVEVSNNKALVSLRLGRWRDDFAGFVWNFGS